MGPKLRTIQPAFVWGMSAIIAVSVLMTWITGDCTCWLATLTAMVVLYRMHRYRKP